MYQLFALNLFWGWDSQFLSKQDKVNTADFEFIFLINFFSVAINGQVGQGKEDGLVWSGLCQKDSQDDFDSEYIGFDGSPDD